MTMVMMELSISWRHVCRLHLTNLRSHFSVLFTAKKRHAAGAKTATQVKRRRVASVIIDDSSDSDSDVDMMDAEVTLCEFS